jgi:hypothetical protein
MKMNTKELLKRYKEELDLEEKIKHNDFEGVVHTFMFRRILFVEHELTEEEYNKMLKHEAYIYSIQDKLLAMYPQLRETIEDVRVKMLEYQLKLVA